MIRICQTANKSIEIDNSTQSMIQLDLPLKSQVFLTNRQQDLQMLNSKKTQFFWDTL